MVELFSRVSDLSERGVRECDNLKQQDTILGMSGLLVFFELEHDQYLIN